MMEWMLFLFERCVLAICFLAVIYLLLLWRNSQENNWTLDNENISGQPPPYNHESGPQLPAPSIYYSTPRKTFLRNLRDLTSYFKPHRFLRYHVFLPASSKRKHMETIFRTTRLLRRPTITYSSFYLPPLML